MHQVQAHSSGQNNFLQIAALANEILDRIAMTDSDDLLFDDRSIVQFRVDVVWPVAPMSFTPRAKAW